MTYGKNQRALLDFLYKHPHWWHRIKRKKAIAAAHRLYRRGVIDLIDSAIPGQAIIYFPMPQMLIKQN